MRPTSARLMTACPVPTLTNLALHDVESLGRSLCDGAGQRQDVLLEHQPGAQRRLTAHGGAPRGPGAAAVGRDRAVAAHDGDPVDLDAQRIGNDLRNAGQRALALVGEAGDATQRAGRIEPQCAAILRRDRRAGRTVIRGTVRGRLTESRDADSPVDAAFAVFALVRCGACRSPSKSRACRGIRGKTRFRGVGRRA